MAKDPMREFLVIHASAQKRTTVHAACVEIESGVAVFYSTLDAALKDITFAIKDFAYLAEV